MIRIVAYAADRKRLLASGEMRMPVYSSRDPAETGRDSYRSMLDAAELMGLMLSEPVLDIGPADWTGGRIVTVRAGVFDALEDVPRAGADVMDRVLAGLRQAAPDRNPSLTAATPPSRVLPT